MSTSRGCVSVRKKYFLSVEQSREREISGKNRRAVVRGKISSRKLIRLLFAKKPVHFDRGKGKISKKKDRPAQGTST